MEQGTVAVQESNAQRGIVTFRLESQIYALPIEPVVRIIEMVAVTPIPRVARSVEGVINVGGTAVPVVNLRRHLELHEVPFQLDTHIVLTQAHGRTTGLIVDEVLDVLDIPADRIANPHDLLPDGLDGTPLLQGLVHIKEGMALLLDLDHLFLPQQASALTEALEALPETLPMEEVPESSEEVPESSEEVPESSEEVVESSEEVVEIAHDEDRGDDGASDQGPVEDSA